MPILKDCREAEHLTEYESLPPAIQKKVYTIEVLFDRAILYIWARTEAAKGVPDFESYLKDLYKNRLKAPKKDFGDILKDLLLKLRAEPDEWLIWAVDHKFCIKILADSSYYPWTGNWSHLTKMLYELWIYWLFWPSGRRFFEEGTKIPSPPPRGSYLCSPQTNSTPPLSFEANLDNSLVWLAFEVGSEIAKIRKHGWREGNRTFKSSEKRRKKADQKKEFIIAIYEHGEPIAPGTRLSETIRIIQRQFEESRESALKKSGRETSMWGAIPDDIKPKKPGRDSIIDLFEAESILERDFEKVGRYWFKKV